MNEFALIDRLTSQLRLSKKSVPVGPGDDCAVVRLDGRVRAWRAMPLLLTTDLLVEGVHFRRDWMTPEEIGFKAARVNLSDIAAMGGIPRFLLVSLGLPKDARGRDAERLFSGLRRAAEEAGAAIVGGDTNASPNLVVNVAVVGASGKRIVSRRGAKPGDDLYVTGTLGGAALGFEVLRRRKKKKGDYAPFLAAHKKPPLRVAVGRVLGGIPGVHAMMDLSDGLAGDLPHILKASRVGAVIDVDALPLPPGFRKFCAGLGVDPLRLAVSGGEDYELLFTAASGAKIPKKIGGVPVAKIGKITPHAGRLEVLGGQGLRLSAGFRHF